MLTDFGRKSFVTWTTGLKERIQKAEKENQMRNYRGLTIDGKWVYGWYVQVEEKHFIITDESRLDYEEDYNVIFRGIIEVIPETVGQQVGLKDKNGKEIYEGDYLKTHRQGNIEDIISGYVLIEGGAFCFAKWKSLPLHALWLAGDVFEVISNIHQNPELMEQDNDPANPR